MILIYDFEKKNLINKLEWDNINEFWILLKFKKLLNFKKIKNLSKLKTKKRNLNLGVVVVFLLRSAKFCIT